MTIVREQILVAFRFDRRLTVGETPGRAVADVEALDAVRAARAAGLRVEVTIPAYRERTWRGYLADNPQIYRGWPPRRTTPRSAPRSRRTAPW